MLMRLRLLMLALAVALPSAALAQDPADPAADPRAPATEVAEVAEVEAADPAAAGDLELPMEDVQSYQEALKGLGYFHGPADGRKGPRTRTALRNFQRDQQLAVTGSFDGSTLDRIDDQARLAGVAPADSAEPAAADAEPTPAPVPARRRERNDVVSKAGPVLKTGAGAVGTAGRATGRGVATGTKATIHAGGVAGRAVGTAGVAVADASTVAAKSVAKSGVFVWDQSRRAVVGDKRGDGDIRKAIERQYADDERIVADEVEVRVSGGNVTLELPEGARTDLAHAVRLAKLTPGVKTVTAVTTAVDAGEPAPASN